MDILSRSDRDGLFAEQSEEFVRMLLEDSKASDRSSMIRVTSRKPMPLTPVILQDHHAISADEKQFIRSDYFSDRGVAYFIALNPNERNASYSHPLLEI